jgi:AcrR family transcriptional regulator
MATHNKTLRNMRLRVLESAYVVFAEKGYRDATLAEIFEHAGANVASID